MTLAVDALSCNRSGRAILRDITFTLAPGEALLLRGPNGVGKSTLLRVLAGLLAPSSGHTSFDGRPLDSEDLAYCGHLDAVKPQLTVAENLAFWCALHGGVDIAPALTAFDLTAIRDQPTHACSAGQKRRLGLARLLVAPRRLWLLDEPTVSLDVATVARFRGVVRDHCATGGLAILATHVPLDLGPTRDLTLTPPRQTAPNPDDWE